MPSSYQLSVYVSKEFGTVDIESPQLSYWNIVSMDWHRGKISLGISSEHLFGVCSEGPNSFPVINVWEFDSIEEAVEHAFFYIKKAFPADARRLTNEMREEFSKLSTSGKNR